MMKLILICFSFFFLITLTRSSPAEKRNRITEPRIVCYYSSWASHRKGKGNFQVEDTDTSLCTHFVYSFAGLNARTMEIESLDPDLDLNGNWGKNSYQRAVKLRETNSKLKVLLSIGGPDEESFKYSVMAADPEKRKAFVDSVVNLLEAIGFDGLDVDWNYPGSNGGGVVDKENFILLLSDLKTAFNQHGWILSIAVGMLPSTTTAGYNIRQIVDLVDFVNLMTYDFRGPWDGKTGHHSQLYVGPQDTGNLIYSNMNASVHLWISGGAPARKLNLGISFSGKTYQVVYKNGPLDEPTVGPGMPGEYTRQPGFIGYNEMCDRLQNEVWAVDTNEFVAAPWAYKSDQWIAYDDVDSITAKCVWGKELGLGGVMAWSIDTDDFRSVCGKGKFPLLKAVNSIWRDDSITPILNIIGNSAKFANPPNAHSPIKLEEAVHGNPTTRNPFYDECNYVGYLRSDTTDCSRYYQCAPSQGGGVWIHQTCPHGLYFSTELNRCNFGWNENCIENRNLQK